MPLDMTIPAKQVVSVQPLGTGKGLGSLIFGDGPHMLAPTRLNLNAAFPPVEQSHLITYDDGSILIILNGSPSSAGLFGQGAGALPIVKGRFGNPKVGTPSVPKNITISNRNLQEIFDKHGRDFGLTGNWNPSRAAEVRQAIMNHINSPSVQKIAGAYRGQDVIHVVDPTSGLNVILDNSGNFIGGWRLSPEQLQSVLNGGRLF